MDDWEPIEGGEPPDNRGKPIWFYKKTFRYNSDIGSRFFNFIKRLFRRKQ